MFADIIRNHTDRYPEMQIQDIYKLVLQAAMGSEHNAADRDSVLKNLNDEMNQLSDLSSNEPLVDTISTDGEIVRVHLRPFMKSSEDISLLAESFQRTTTDYPGQKNMIKTLWEDAIELDLFPRETMNEFINNMEEMNFPAIHHSEPYRLAYQPAYRVIWRKFLPIKMKGGK
jgi:hypothetical protein